MTNAFEAIVNIAELPRAGLHKRLEASPDARAMIAERLAVDGVVRLAGDLAITPTARGAVVRGDLDALLKRQCVLTLEPMEEAVREIFEIEFVRARAIEDEEIEIGPDTPEPLEADTLDLAELLVQQLALAMAPYPRSSDASASHSDVDASLSPFADLEGKIADDGGAE